jgi:hypothetical protein
MDEPTLFCYENSVELKTQFHDKILRMDAIPWGPFIHAIRASNAILSGSTILKTIQDALDTSYEWKYSVRDVDIYVAYKDHKNLIDALRPIFDYSHIPLKNSNRETYICKELTLFDRTDDYKWELPHIAALYTFTCRVKQTVSNYEVMSYRRPYQIIVLEDGYEPTEYVAQFDLTFCRNFYDGRNFYSYHKEHIIQRAGYIITCPGVVPSDKGRMKTSERIKKYEAHGYTILNKEAVLDN